MYTVTGIIDMDVFTVGKKIYCKELAMMKQDDTYATSILFDLGLSWNQLNKKDQISARYLENTSTKSISTPHPTYPRS